MTVLTTEQTMSGTVGIKSILFLILTTCKL